MDAHAHSVLSTQIGSAAVCAYIVQLLQKWSRTPWITQHTTGINTAVRIATSGLAALGVGWAWGELSPDGGHSLIIHIPPAAVILAGLWHWFTQYAIQHGWGNLLNPPPAQVQLPVIAPPPGQPVMVEPPKEKQ